MGKTILNDAGQEITQEVLQSVMGANYQNYISVEGILAGRQLSATWNFYKDGKSWLCKVQHKKKTVLWLSVWEDCFKLSFFFTEKTKEGIGELDIASQIKENFRKQEVAGKLIPLIIEVRGESVIVDVEKIIDYRIKCK